MRTPDQMIQQEVLCCMSGIVATLANGANEATARKLHPALFLELDRK